MGDHRILDAQIARLHELAKMPEQVAPEVAVALKGVLGAQIAAGNGPDGTPLPRTKDGRQPLKNADRALTVRAIGAVVLARIEGHHALHHQGRARGGVRRAILPSNAIPAPVAKAVGEVCTARFKKTMGVR